MKKILYATLFAGLFVSQAYTNMLDEELDLSLIQPEEQDLNDESLAQFEEELKRMAQEAEAVEADKEEQCEVQANEPIREEIVIIEEESSDETLRQKEALAALAKELEELDEE